MLTMRLAPSFPHPQLWGQTRIHRNIWTMAAHQSHRRFDTRRIPPSLRVSVWQNLSSRFLVPLHISAMSPTIEGQMCSYQRDERSEEHTSELQSRGHLVC